MSHTSLGTGHARRVFLAVVAVVAFLFAVQLLGTATTELAPDLEAAFRGVVHSPLSALGVSWLAAYGMLNGSVVAALALSLFGADLVPVEQLFLMVAGSRLGAAGIVLIIGALDYVGKRHSLREASGLGVLAFLVTHSIYLPATILGYPLLVPMQSALADVRGFHAVDAGWLTFFAPLAVATTDAVGGPAAFLVAFLVLFGSLKLFDRAVGSFDTARFRERSVRYLGNPWLSFLVGLVVTGLTTSVAFSLGVVVPLYNRGYVEQEEIVPYTMGASIGTLTDTVLVALLLDTPVGVEVVLVLGTCALAVTLVCLFFFARYVAVVDAVHRRLVTERSLFVAFVVALLVVPGVFVFF